eukprot:1146966-Pelagomonas_calceolata.AAC.9
MEPGASSNPPDPPLALSLHSFVVKGTHGPSKPMRLLFLNLCRETWGTRVPNQRQPLMSSQYAQIPPLDWRPPLTLWGPLRAWS